MKKGFTLIEMIGIIVILAVILLVTVPATITTLNKSNKNRYQSFKNNLKIVAENYIVDKQKISETSVTISLNVLKEEHYIEEIPTIPGDDPFALEGGTTLEGAYILATKNVVTKVYSYQLCKSSGECELLS